MYRYRDRFLFLALVAFGLTAIGCIEQPKPLQKHVDQIDSRAASAPATVPAASHYPVYDEHNVRELVGDGNSVVVGNQRYYLSRQPPPPAEAARRKAMFKEQMKLIPRSEWPARIKAQAAARARVSDYCNFPAYDQKSTNYCWINGPCQAFTIARLQMGLPYRRISSASIGGPITGYKNVGGWELDGIVGLTNIGATTEDAWPNAAINRAYNTEAVALDRENYKAIEWVELETFDEFATACLEGFPCAVAYNWWRHVVVLCDLVELGPNRYGFLIRNSWSDAWGAKNELGYGGFAILAEGKGTPSSGFMLRQVRPSAKPVITNASRVSFPDEGQPYQAADGSWHIVLDGHHCWREGDRWTTIINGKKRQYMNGRWYECDGRGCRPVSLNESFGDLLSPINPLAVNYMWN